MSFMLPWISAEKLRPPRMEVSMLRGTSVRGEEEDDDDDPPEEEEEEVT